MIDRVTPSWRKKASRLARMGWGELQSRARQEVSKRLDLALYRAGVLAGSMKSPSGSEPVVPAKFFFAADEIASRARLVREHLPAEVESLIREADEICHHRFRLLGYENLDYGEDIDWHLDAVHGKRAPLKPWFKIHFLDFDEVGDHKVIWELNRHQHLVTLAKAGCLTGEGKYVTELIRQWYAWQRANPYPIGINWGSSLEVAFRSLSWLWVRALIANCEAVPKTYEADLMRALASNGRYIEKYLSTYFSPNTHLLGEAVALFFLGTLCPQLEWAGRWRHAGWRMVLEEADRQVRPDGVYFEQSLYYHVYALDFFLHARLLAARNGTGVPESFDRILEKMCDVLRALSQTGPPDGFGDDDGGRLFNPRRNGTEHLTDPLAIGAVLFERDDLKASAGLTEESLWLCGEDAVSSLAAGRKDLRSKLNPRSFRDGGIYVMASSGESEQQLVVDAGPQGIGHSGHGHADALSLRVSVNGRRWLVDPGAYCYLGEERNRFRGTAAHNTVRVDGHDQSIPQGPFAWSSLPTVHADRWTEGKTFSLFEGNHTGYLRLPDPVLHRRFVFHLHDGFWLVRDVVEGQEKHQLETFWHFAPGLEIVKTADAFVARPTPPWLDDLRVALLPARDPARTPQLDSGFVSPAYGRKEPAAVVVSSHRTQLPAEHSSLLVPLLDRSEGPGTLFSLGKPGEFAVPAYRYDGLGKSHLMIFAGRGQPWSFGPWTSDADFLYCGVEQRRVSHWIQCGGSVARLGGQSVFAHRGKVERLEWTRRAGISQAFCSEDGALKDFSEGVLHDSDSVF